MFRVGIVGLGGITLGAAPTDLGYGAGERHAATHAAAYAAQPNTEVVAVCDVNQARIDKFMQCWSPRWPAVKSYTDYNHMLSSCALDILSICTPDHIHADVAICAAKSGVRGIICEKPVATTLHDADRMIEAVRASGTAMVVDYTRRWYIEFMEARRLIRSGEIGKVLYVDALLGSPRSMLFRNATHLIDAMLYLVGGDPEWVISHLPDPFSNYGPVYTGRGGLDPSEDPDCSALIGLSNGIRASLHAVRNASLISETRVIGDRGSVIIRQDYGGTETAEWAIRNEKGLTFRHPLPRNQYSSGSVAGAIRELIGILEGNVTEQTSPPEEARKSLAIKLAILQSHHYGKRIQFPVYDAPTDDAEASIS